MKSSKTHSTEKVGSKIPKTDYTTDNKYAKLPKQNLPEWNVVDDAEKDSTGRQFKAAIER
ncbi:hypothetical protein AVEN_128452-1, partial [Araneus ventricosus]